MRLFIFLIIMFANPAFAKEYNLIVENKNININGRVLKGLSINNSVPAPTLEFTEGDEVVINVTNKSNEPTSLHWHGLYVPPIMDGVPDLNGFKAIQPNASFTYKFTLRQNGTYWYHSHSGGQEARGLYGALIIHPKQKENFDRNYTILLSDFSDETPDQIIRNLKINHGHYINQRRTIGDFLADSKKFGLKASVKDRLAWGQMRMDPTDIADVTGYDFLINGKTEAQTFIAKKGEKVKFRIINGSAMTYFDFQIIGASFKAIGADGQDIKPIEGKKLRIAVAETYDIEIIPQSDEPLKLIFESMDRSGFVGAYLASQEITTPINHQLSARTILNMNDMGMHGMDHSKMDHSNMTKDEMEAMNKEMANMPQTLDMIADKDGKNRNYGWGKDLEDNIKYSDLESAKTNTDPTEIDREINVVLGGNMSRYIWTINGKSGMDIEPIQLKHNEKVKINFINQTMMAHPMHLHGMYLKLDNGKDPAKLPDKHIVSVEPGQTYSAYLIATEKGEWSFHCHLLNHMASGMMTKVTVADYGISQKAHH